MIWIALSVVLVIVGFAALVGVLIVVCLPFGVLAKRLDAIIKIHARLNRPVRGYVLANWRRV